MAESVDPRELAERCRRGDEDACRQLFDCYVERLVALARRRISQRLASRVDPEDIVQSVFRTFFGRLKAGRFRLEEQDDLCKLLMRITVHKALRQIHFHQAAKRNPRAELGQGTEANERLLAVIDRDPSPDEAVAFVDHLENFLGGLKAQEREILEMRLQGYSNEEIAQKLGIYDRKIRRVIERLRGMAVQENWSA